MADVFGPAHNAVEYLVDAGYDVDFVLHPLADSSRGFVRIFRNGELVHEERILGGPFHRFREAAFTLRRVSDKEADLLVLVDPLNYAPALIARRLRRSAPMVFFTADYADRRFVNPLLNRLYHALDRAAIRDADAVWNVSKRITSKRTEQGVPSDQNFFIPNSPSFDEARVLPWVERIPDSVVCVGKLDAYLDNSMLIEALDHLRTSRPNLRLTWVGDGPELDALKEAGSLRDLNQNLDFLGQMSHEETLAVIRRSRVGLALYSGSAPWSEYCDSLKVREYLAFGVPVVSTVTHPLAKELEERGAGVLVSNAKEAAQAIDRLLGVEGQAAVDATLELARENSREVLLGPAIEALERRRQRGRSGRTKLERRMQQGRSPGRRA